MLVIAEKRGDQMSKFHNALYAGDVKARIAVLKDVGMRKYQMQMSLSNPNLGEQFLSRT